MGPLIGAALIGGGFQALGGALSNGGKVSRQQLEEQAREFNISQPLAEEQARSQIRMAQGSDINAMQRQMEMAPMRDKVSYMLNQRMGMVPQQFQGRDMFNPQSSPQTPQMGGIDSAQLQGAMQNYHAPNFMTDQAGSGGIDPRMYHMLMARLGVSGPYGQQTVGDLPIERSTYSNPWAPHPLPQTGAPNPNGMGSLPGSPNGIKVNPPGTPPWGTQGPGIGGGMPGSQPMLPQRPPLVNQTRRP